MSSHNTPKESSNASVCQSKASDLLINIDYCATNEKISFEIFRPEMEQNSILKHDILLGKNRSKFKNTAEINKFLASLTDPRFQNIKLDGQTSKDEIDLRTTHNHFLTSTTNHINEIPERDNSIKPKEKRSHTVIQSMSQENDTIDHFYETLFDSNTPKKYKKLKNRMLKRVKSDTNIALRYQYLRKNERERSRKVRNDHWQQKHREKKEHASVNTRSRGEPSNYTEHLEHNRTQFAVILSPRNRSPHVKSPDRDKSKSPSPTRNRQIIVKSNTLGLVRPAMKTVGQQTNITTLHDKEIIPDVSIQSSARVSTHNLKTAKQNSSYINIKMLKKPWNENVTARKQSKHNLTIVNQDLNISAKQSNENVKILSKKSHHNLKTLTKQSLQHLSMSIYDCVDIKSSNSNTKLSNHVKPTIPRRPRNESPSPITPRYSSPQRYEDRRPQIPRRFINEKVKQESNIIDDNDLLKMKMGDCLNPNQVEQTVDQSNKQIEHLCAYFKNLLEETVKTHLNPDTKNDEYNMNSSPTFRYSRNKTKTGTAVNEKDLKRKLDLFCNYSSPDNINDINNAALPKNLKRTTSATNSKIYQCSFNEHVPIETEQPDFFPTKNDKTEPQTKKVIDDTGKVVMKQVVIDNLDKVHMYGAINALQYVKRKQQEGNLGSSVRFNSQVDILDDQNKHNIGHLGDSMHAHNLILPVANKMQRSFTSPNKKDFYKSAKKSASVMSIARSSNKQLSKSSIDLNSSTITLTSIQKSVAIRSNTSGSFNNSTLLFTKSEYSGDTCFKRRYNYFKLLKSKMARRALRPAKDMRPKASELKKICPHPTALPCPLECLSGTRKKKFTSDQLNIFADSCNNEKRVCNTRRNPSRNTLIDTKDRLAGSFKSTADHTTLSIPHRETNTTHYLKNTRPNPRKYLRKCQHEEKPINVQGYNIQPESKTIKNRYCANNKLQRTLPKNLNPASNKNAPNTLVANKVKLRPNILGNENKSRTLANKQFENKIKFEEKHTKLQSQNKQTSKTPPSAKPAHLATKDKTSTQFGSTKKNSTLLDDIITNISNDVITTEKIPETKSNKLIPGEITSDVNGTIYIGFTPSDKIANKLNVLIPLEQKISDTSSKTNSSSSGSTTSLISLNRKKQSSILNTVINKAPVELKNGTNTNNAIKKMIPCEVKKENEAINLSKPINVGESTATVNTLIELENKAFKIEGTSTENCKTELLKYLIDQTIISTKTDVIPKQTTTTVKKSGIPVAINRPKPLLPKKTNEPRMLCNTGKEKSCLNKENLKSKTVGNVALKKCAAKTEGKNFETKQLDDVTKRRQEQNSANKIKHVSRQNSFVTTNKINPTVKEIPFTDNKIGSNLLNKNICKTNFNRQKSLPWTFNMTTIEETSKIFAKPKSSITDITRNGAYKKESNCKTNFNRQNSLPGTFGQKTIEENKIFAKPKSSITDIFRNGSHIQRTTTASSQNKRCTSHDRYFSMKPNAKKPIVPNEVVGSKKPNNDNNNATYSHIHARKTDISPINRSTLNTNNKTIIDKKLEDKPKIRSILKSPRASSVPKQNILQNENPNKSKTATQANKKPLDESSDDELYAQEDDKSNIYKPVTKQTISATDKSPTCANNAQFDKMTNQCNALRLLESLTTEDQDQSWLLGKRDILPVNFVLLDYNHPLDVTRYSMNKITKELCEPLANISEVVKEAPPRKPKLRGVHTIPASIKKYFNFKSKKLKEKVSNVNTDK